MLEVYSSSLWCSPKVQKCESYTYCWSQPYFIGWSNIIRIWVVHSYKLVNKSWLIVQGKKTQNNIYYLDGKALQVSTNHLGLSNGGMICWIVILNSKYYNLRFVSFSQNYISFPVTNLAWRKRKGENRKRKQKKTSTWGRINLPDLVIITLVGANAGWYLAQGFFTSFWKLFPLQNNVLDQSTCWIDVE